LKYKTKSIKI